VEGIYAFAGMHGSSRGVSFDIRHVPSSPRIEIRIAFKGITLKSPPDTWDVHCYNEEAHVHLP
jgi:hypothetical protein